MQRLVLLTLAYISIAVIGVGLVQITVAAQTNEQRVREIDKAVQQLERDKAEGWALHREFDNRIKVIEGLQLEKRLVTLEVYAETNRTLLFGIAIAVVAQVVEMLFRILKGRTKPS